MNEQLREASDDSRRGENERSSFERVERRRLIAVAYRMTGTLADAEDVVQETYVRWLRLSDDERSAIESPAAWLTRVAGRVALDLLGSARARRESYVGQWLPEPVPLDIVVGSGAASARAAVTDPLDRVTLDETVGSALMVVLESMTPAERVAFVLHDVFGMPFDEVAQIVGRTPGAARQLAATGRRHVREKRHAVVTPIEHDRVVRAFRDASVGGDLDRLLRLLAPDVELRADGGGVVTAAPNVVSGADRVARFLLGVLAKQPTLRFAERATADGLGLTLNLGDQLFGVVTFGVHDGRISGVWLVLNPAKLTAWAP